MWKICYYIKAGSASPKKVKGRSRTEIGEKKGVQGAIFEKAKISRQGELITKSFRVIKLYKVKTTFNFTNCPLTQRHNS